MVDKNKLRKAISAVKTSQKGWIHIVLQAVIQRVFCTRDDKLQGTGEGDVRQPLKRGKVNTLKGMT